MPGGRCRHADNRGGKGRRFYAGNPKLRFDSEAVHDSQGRFRHAANIRVEAQASKFEERGRALEPQALKPRPCMFPAMPRSEFLETFPNPYPDRAYEIHMDCHEFTSLCPLGGVESDASELALLKGGAPDFGVIHITYVPGDRCIELKSLKLYLWSFRDSAVFYERAVNRILDDLHAAVAPRWMQVVGDFNVRGGIKSVITASVGERPDARGKP